MPVYHYSGVDVPREGQYALSGTTRVARISYMKAFGDAPPGWIVGYGRFENNKFVMEDEIVARHLV
ncbi:MAG: hypothetical protein QXV62_03875, partial [Nitrososphaerota archaeon]